MADATKWYPDVLDQIVRLKRETDVNLQVINSTNLSVNEGNDKSRNNLIPAAAKAIKRIRREAMKMLMMSGKTKKTR